MGWAQKVSLDFSVFTQPLRKLYIVLGTIWPCSVQEQFYPSLEETSLCGSRLGFTATDFLEAREQAVSCSVFLWWLCLISNKVVTFEWLQAFSSLGHCFVLAEGMKLSLLSTVMYVRLVVYSCSDQKVMLSWKLWVWISCYLLMSRHLAGYVVCNFLTVLLWTRIIIFPFFFFGIPWKEGSG